MRTTPVLAVVLAIPLLLPGGPAGAAIPLGTAFTYQGLLRSNGGNVNDNCDFEFMLFDDPVAGTQIGSTLTFDGIGGNPAPVAVVDGIFTVKLDFGADAFDGDARWLDISVRCPSGVGNYEPLSPRQPICATPYAIRALIDETFALPFAATIDEPQAAFQIRNDGGEALVGITSGFNDVAVAGLAVDRATAGQFRNLSGPGVLDPGPVVSIESNVSQRALQVLQSSDSTAGQFQASGRGTALYAWTTYPNANGHAAAVFETSDALGGVSQNASATVLVINKGKGSAGRFETEGTGETNNVPALMARTDSAGPAFEARTTGQGGAGSFLIESSGSNGIGVEILTDANGVALRSATTGNGSAGAFSIIDPSGGQTSSSSAALAASTAGLGPAGFFLISRPENADPSLEAITNGTGPAGSFLIARPENADPAVEASTDGTGPAGHFVTGGTDPGLQNNATLRAVQLRGNNGGSAGEFITLNPQNGDVALLAAASGQGGAGEFLIDNNLPGASERNEAEALKATTLGFGRAGLFEIVSGPPVDNTMPALEARTAGTGPAGHFFISNPNGPPGAGAVEGRNSGLGPAGEFLIDNPATTGATNNAAAVDAKTVAFGSAGRFEIDRLFEGTGEDPVNTSPALHVTSNAAGPAALIESNRTGGALTPTLHVKGSSPDTLAHFESTSPQTVTVVKATGVGGGIVGEFETINESSGNPTVKAFSNGVGPAGSFQVVNPGATSNALEAIANNSRHALFAQQTGAGEAAHFEIADPGNGNLGVFIKNNGTGQALQVMNTNPFFGALALGVIGKSAFNGQVDILGQGGGAVPVNITGDVSITGNLGLTGGQLCATSVCAAVKNFRIDHPLDPGNKYLQHTSVESDEMKNVYDGTVVLDESGEAVVRLPEWFEALNRDFRYQLTCIGGFAPVYIAEEITDRRFRIAGGRPGMKVSWQITGVRQDTYAREHPLQVEVEKTTEVAGASRGRLPATARTREGVTREPREATQE